MTTTAAAAATAALLTADWLAAHQHRIEAELVAAAPNNNYGLPLDAVRWTGARLLADDDEAAAFAALTPEAFEARFKARIQEEVEEARRATLLWFLDVDGTAAAAWAAIRARLADETGLNDDQKVWEALCKVMLDPSGAPTLTPYPIIGTPEHIDAFLALVRPLVVAEAAAQEAVRVAKRKAYVAGQRAANATRRAALAARPTPSARAQPARAANKATPLGSAYY
jgi:hypothetical protein